MLSINNYDDFQAYRRRLRSARSDYSIKELVDFYFQTILEMFVNQMEYTDIPPGFDTEAFEIISYLQGQCCVVLSKDNKVYPVINGYEYGIGPYSDVPFHERFIKVGMTSPYLGSYTNDDGNGIVMCHNTATNNSFTPIFMKSAVNLAHIDKSIEVFAVNSRLHGIFFATDRQDIEKVNNFYNNLIEGKFGTIQNGDSIIPNINYTELPTRSQSELNSLIIARNNEMRYICRLAGISMDKDKVQAVLSNESEQDDSFLANNISKIYEQRKKSVEAINRMASTNMKVKLKLKKDALEMLANEKELSNSFTNETNGNGDLSSEASDKEVSQ